MTIKAMIGAAAAAGFLAFAAPGAAQAMPANAGLNTATSVPASGVTQVHWRPYYHRHHHRWNRGWRHHRRCWTVRKIVRWHNGHRVVRKVRRCS